MNLGAPLYAISTLPLARIFGKGMLDAVCAFSILDGTTDPLHRETVCPPQRNQEVKLDEVDKAEGRHDVLCRRQHHGAPVVPSCPGADNAGLHSGIEADLRGRVERLMA